ncbi:SCO2583 family membrane protein [Streptomyces specialis]|uniref:SCO2583 family membrane protein n=1 Tax=Streptomyces specialis TaxID=498367 RepID=UPI00073F7938|nr:hypothetical protein [Streptomyces specialis]
MAGRTDPPDGAPGGTPGAGDEEYQSTVFDESFVRAARLQEFSAQERLEDHTTAVRRRLPESVPGFGRVLPKQALALGLVVLLAFAAAIYLGAGGPYEVDHGIRADPPAGSLVALVPEGEVPGSADTSELYAGSPAEGYGAGAGGVALPDPSGTADFSREQVLTALTLAKEYVVASALTPNVLAGATTIPVRELLGAEQQRQFDSAVGGRDPVSDATDWLIRFDPDEALVADPQVRVTGDFTFTQISEDILQVDGHHVFVYALRPPGALDTEAALFTVRRLVRFQFGKEELRDRTVVLRETETVAGPMDCGTDVSVTLSPLLAGDSPAAPPPGAFDPYAMDGEPDAPCGAFPEDG